MQSISKLIQKVPKIFVRRKVMMYSQNLMEIDLEAKSYKNIFNFLSKRGRKEIILSKKYVSFILTSCCHTKMCCNFQQE